MNPILEVAARIASGTADMNAATEAMRLARLEIDRLRAENAELLEALRDECEYHHLPLFNGWAHRIERDGRLDNGRVVRCRLSEKARIAIRKAMAATAPDPSQRAAERCAEVSETPDTPARKETS